MGIDTARYHGWQGTLRSPWYSTLAIVRVALLQVFRRKSYWIVFALGLLNFLLYWSIIYGVTQFDIPPRAQRDLLEGFGFSSHPAAGQDSGYILFMHRQSMVVMILLAFSGSLLIGSDFRMNSLPFYLSRRIDRKHYIVGKLMAISAIVSLMTTVPALILFLEYGLFTSSLDYWRNNWQIVISVVTYGFVLCAVLSILLVTLSSYLHRMAPIAITWSCLFVMLGNMARVLKSDTDNLYWHLIDPWRDMRYAGKLCFGSEFESTTELRVAWLALLILICVCALAMLALVRRVRAVDVVS